MSQQHALGCDLRQMLVQAPPVRMEGHRPVEGIALHNEHIRVPRGVNERRNPLRVPGIAKRLVLHLAAQRIGGGS